MHVLDNLKIKLLFPSLDFKCFSTDFFEVENRRKFAKLSASKPDITHKYKNPRLTTRGVEQIAILESVDSQQENSHDVEDTYLDGSKSVANQQQ